MIVNESNGIAGVCGIVREGCLVQITPVAAVVAESSVDIVLHGEVESSTLDDAIYFCAVQPVGYHRLVAVPALANGELRIGRLVILAYLFGCIPFHEIITKADIAQIIEQEIKIGVDVLLHIGTRMV